MNRKENSKQIEYQSAKIISKQKIALFISLLSSKTKKFKGFFFVYNNWFTLTLYLFYSFFKALLTVTVLFCLLFVSDYINRTKYASNITSIVINTTITNGGT